MGQAERAVTRHGNPLRERSSCAVVVALSSALDPVLFSIQLVQRSGLCTATYAGRELAPIRGVDPRARALRLQSREAGWGREELSSKRRNAEDH
ncbi:hypothetical protein PsorP6_014878 [Peronosclerospora sorghi]|uniref:Uncharacterized protein n=1 Tax=Peronosclerospora sorghi TaxID=230839 RepID=A0ACC0VRU0_9STRA|nr:hypothetical protein PsorP6_014878 [Peronosclerospora sorghi]